MLSARKSCEQINNWVMKVSEGSVPIVQGVNNQRPSLRMPIGCFLITPRVWGMEAELPAHFGIPESPTSV